MGAESVVRRAMLVMCLISSSTPGVLYLGLAYSVLETRPSLPPRSTRHPTLVRPIHRAADSLDGHTPLLQRTTQLLDHRLPRLGSTGAIPTQLLAGLILVDDDRLILVFGVEPQVTRAGISCGAYRARRCRAAQLAASTALLVSLVFRRRRFFTICT